MHCLGLLNEVQENNEKSYRSTLYENMERHYVGWSGTNNHRRAEMTKTFSYTVGLISISVVI